VLLASATGQNNTQAPAAVLEPEFVDSPSNVTVSVGETAFLPCIINNIGHYTAVWKDEHGSILTNGSYVAINDTRFSMYHNTSGTASSMYMLVINNVKAYDQGQYQCVVNTATPMVNTKNLVLKVPAQIVKELSSGHVIVKEGNDVELVCHVTGVPKPQVLWVRRTARGDPVYEIIAINEEKILIKNPSPYDNYVYECTAYNGVGPTVRRTMWVTVETFSSAPEIQITKFRVEQPLGGEAVLECRITAAPQVIKLWYKSGQVIGTSSGKRLVEIHDDGDHTITLSLRISDINENDYGEYKCFGANQLGQSEKSVWLYRSEMQSGRRLDLNKVNE